MTNFAVLATVAVFAIGAAFGRAKAPTPALASEAKSASMSDSISIEELTGKAGPLPVESFDAV